MTEPHKLTLTGILRWIFGVIFALACLGALIGGHVLPAIIALIAVLLLIPPISTKIESAINLTLSGGLRAVLIIVLLVSFGAAMPTQNVATTNSNVAQSGVAQNPVNVQTPGSTNVCYWDWHFMTGHQISSISIAPPGKSYAIAEIYVKNNADSSISTSPYNWNLVVDNITYMTDSASFDPKINAQSVDIGKGGEITFNVVYLVNGEPNYGVLKYMGLMPPEMVRVQHFNNTSA